MQNVPLPVSSKPSGKAAGVLLNIGSRPRKKVVQWSIFRFFLHRISHSKSIYGISTTSASQSTTGQKQIRWLIKFYDVAR